MHINTADALELKRESKKPCSPLFIVNDHVCVSVILHLCHLAFEVEWAYLREER